MENSEKKKPTVKLVGEDGNVFNLMGIYSRVLKRAGMANEAKEMCEKITKTAKVLSRGTRNNDGLLRSGVIGQGELKLPLFFLRRK